jgi:hypothetical protein
MSTRKVVVLGHVRYLRPTPTIMWVLVTFILGLHEVREVLVVPLKTLDFVKHTPSTFFPLFSSLPLHTIPVLLRLLFCRFFVFFQLLFELAEDVPGVQTPAFSNSYCLCCFLQGKLST